jgi:peptidyl-prolyl cis-trans isomerase D
MLQKIREKITGWVAGIILALLAFVFAVWGIDIGFSNQSVAAVVNGDKIPIGPVRQAIQSQLSQFQQAYGADVPAVIENQVRDGVIDGFVRNRLLLQRIRSEGYRVSNEALSESIREIPSFQVNGEFSLDAYRAMLANVGYSPTLFEAEQRQNMEISQLQSGITTSAFVTPAELERWVRIDRERRDLAWLVVPVERFTGKVEVSDEQIAAEYAAHPDRYMSPETVDVEYVELSIDDIMPTVSVTDDQLREYYETEVGRDPQMFSTPEQREARHILIAVDEDTDDQQAQAKAEAVLERLRAGEDFAEVARETSDDSGSASLGGELGWVERGMMVAPFEEALFSMEPGQLSDPVKSPFGYHIIELEGIRAGDVKTFDEARDDLLVEYRHRTAEDIFYTKAERLYELTFESPDTLAPAASELGLEIKRIDGMARGGGSGLAGDPKVIDAAFSETVMNEGENSEPVEIEEGHVVVLRNDGHHEAAPRPLDEVRDNILARLQREAARSKAAEVGTELTARLESGESPAAVAESVNAQFNDSRPVGRASTDVPVLVKEAAFSAELDGERAVGSLPLSDGSFAAWVLTGITPGDVNTLSEAERAQLRQQLARATGGEDFSGYIAELRNSATIVVNREQFE